MDQFVIACITSEQDAAVVVPVAHYFAEQLNHKGVRTIPLQKHNAIERISELPTTYGGILAIVAVNPDAPRHCLNNPRTLLRNFSHCKIAYLCISLSSQPSTLISPFSTHLTLTDHRQSKEKLLWASYLARFLHSNLTIFLPKYKDDALIQRQHNNRQFLEKLYNSLNIQYTLARLNHKPFRNPDIQLLEHSSNTTVLVALTTDPRERDLIDILSAPPELRILKQSGDKAILFLNPSDDLYITCD